MVIYTTIATDDESYILSALIEKGMYTMPSLKFMLNGVESDLWDNEDYLINDVYNYLKTGEGSGKLVETFSYVREEVLELFNAAINMGFFIDKLPLAYLIGKQFTVPWNKTTYRIEVSENPDTVIISWMVFDRKNTTEVPFKDAIDFIKTNAWKLG